MGDILRLLARTALRVAMFSVVGYWLLIGGLGAGKKLGIMNDQ